LGLAGSGKDALHLSEEWFAYMASIQRGMPAWEKRLQRVHPEDRARWQGALDQAIDKKSEYEVEFRILLPDGTVKHIHSAGHPVLNASRDLCNSWVARRTSPSASRRKKRCVRRRGICAREPGDHDGRVHGLLAHEVNQPIAAAVTDARTCLRWLTREQPDVEEARRAASRMVKDATRAAEIISRIRLLFKKGTAERELVDVNEMIER